MNELPDDLWLSEHYRTNGIPARSASDVGEEIDPFPFITDESVLLVGLGMLAIAYSSAVTALLAVTAGLSITLISRRLRVSMSHRGETPGVSQFTST